MIPSSLELLHFVAIQGTGLLHIQFYHELDIFLTWYYWALKWIPE